MYVCFIVIPPRCINQWSDIQSCRAVLDPLQATNMIASVAHRIRSARGGWARGSRVLKPFGVERGRFLEARVLTCGLSAFAVQSSRLGKSPVTFVPRGRGKRLPCLFDGVLGAASVPGHPIPFTLVAELPKERLNSRWKKRVCDVMPETSDGREASSSEGPPGNFTNQ